MLRALVAIVCFLCLSATAWAGQCDCSVKHGACGAVAQIDLPRQSITFQSNYKGCAQIIYSVAGEPSSVTIQGGSGTTDYLVTNTNGDHSLKVDSCTECTLVMQPDNACQDNCQATLNACNGSNCFSEEFACLQRCPWR